MTWHRNKGGVWGAGLGLLSLIIVVGLMLYLMVGTVETEGVRQKRDMDQMIKDTQDIAKSLVPQAATTPSSQPAP